MYFSGCKSRLSAIARSCFLGRAAAKEKCGDAERGWKEALEEVARLEAENARLREVNQQSENRIAKLEAEVARPRPVTLPIGEPPPGMQYGAGLIELCVNLSRGVGLRPVVRALEIFFQWLKVEVSIPTYQGIRTWMQRLGLDRMQRPQRADGGVWIGDHTNQIGKEKALVLLRVPDDRPPGAGPLRQEELEVLAVIPRESWKREDVLEVYRAQTKKYGVPRAISTDGAPELQEPIATQGAQLAEILPKTMRNKPKPLLAFRDPKHFLSNQLEALLSRDPAWQEFSQQVGATRSAVQQTELAHFTPPSFKTKARFMNLKATLRWAQAVLWHLERPDSKSRRGITVQRMKEKLGWLQQFAPKLREWQTCQDVVSTALTFLNEHGLFRGAATQLKKLVAEHDGYPSSEKLIQALLKFVEGYESQLQARERLPMSTEILESCFAKYKQLEQQHSKGGFTSLLLVFPVLLRPTTAAEIASSMQRVKTKDVTAWKQKHLTTTLTSRRQLLYREANPKRNRATPIATVK
jgi:hypothetical protein